MQGIDRSAKQQPKGENHPKIDDFGIQNQQD